MITFRLCIFGKTTAKVIHILFYVSYRMPLCLINDINIIIYSVAQNFSGLTIGSHFELAPISFKQVTVISEKFTFWNTKILQVHLVYPYPVLQ